MSLGAGYYDSYCDSDSDQLATKAAIDTLRSVNIATVIASGNDGYSDGISAPACISSAVSVGSTTDADVVSSFSNVASFLSLLAPGSSITSSVPGVGYETWSGTSMAAPHVAGAWAVLKSKMPSASVSEILTSLQTSGVTVDDTRPGWFVTGMKRIQVDAALSTSWIYLPLILKNFD
jgi:subtilisin family serine protease